MLLSPNNITSVLASSSTIPIEENEGDGIVDRSTPDTLVVTRATAATRAVARCDNVNPFTTIDVRVLNSVAPCKLEWNVVDDLVDVVIADSGTNVSTVTYPLVLVPAEATVIADEESASQCAGTAIVPSFAVTDGAGEFDHAYSRTPPVIGPALPRPSLGGCSRNHPRRSSPGPPRQNIIPSPAAPPPEAPPPAAISPRGAPPPAAATESSSSAASEATSSSERSA